MYFYSGNNNASKSGATAAQSGVNNVPSGNTQEKVVQNAQSGASVKQAPYGNGNQPTNIVNGNLETVQSARKDLAGEIEAIIQYDSHVHELNAPELAKKTWESIRDEELVHVGELLGLLEYLAPYQRVFVERGYNEFKERMEGK